MRLGPTFCLACLFVCPASGQISTFYVDEVLDAASYSPEIARGSIFVAKGMGFCAPGLNLATPPYRDSLAGVSVELTPSAGGTPVKALILHTYSGPGVTQVAAILPSNVPAGAYKLTVSNGGRTTSPFSTTVANRKFRLLTNNQQGFGTAVAQNWVSGSRVDRNMFAVGALPDGQTKGPAKPGQTIILWGTGLGPIDGPDGEPPGAVDLRGQADVSVVVGGRKLKPDYAGRAPQYPGADQVNLTLPADVPLGCNVELQVLVDGQAGNVNTLSIAPAGATACEHPRLTSAHLERLDQGKTLMAGIFTLSAMTVPLDAGNTVFARADEIGGYFFALDAGTVSNFDESSVAPGRCSALRIKGTLDEFLPSTPFYDSADAGNVTLTGPNLSNRALNGDDDYYYLLLAAREESTGMPLGSGNNLPLTPGTYTIRGPGGSQIGPFEASLTMPEILRWTNRDGTREVQRNSGLLVNWTGGAPADLVGVLGLAATVIGGSSSNPRVDGAMFYCSALAGDLSLTVPAEVLSQLPAVSGNGITDIGALVVVSARPVGGRFTAPLVSGGQIDVGIFAHSVAIMKLMPYR